MLRGMVSYSGIVSGGWKIRVVCLERIMRRDRDFMCWYGVDADISVVVQEFVLDRVYRDIDEDGWVNSGKGEQ